MTRMKDLSVRSKLSLGFGLLLILLLAVTAIGVNNMLGLRDSLVQVAEVSHVKAKEAQELSYLVMDSARVVRNVLLLTDPAKQSANKATLDANADKAKALLADLQGLVASEEGQRLVEQLKALNLQYLEFSQDVVKLGMNQQSDQGLALLYGPRYAVQGEYLNALKSTVARYETQMTEAAAQAKAESQRALWVVSTVAALAVVLGVVVAQTLTRSITVPMAQAVQAADAVRRGDLTAAIPQGNGDEVGQLLRALRDMQASLTQVVANVRSNSENVATASAQIAQGNQDLSQRTEEQASALQQTAATMEQLNGTVRHNTDSAKQANQLAQDASTVAAQGGEVVGEVVSTMQGISDSSRRIGDIIGVIDGIAFQTNILALNAAVEAARAGEQGRGFAVVAGEVRTLAQRSAEAAKEIKTLIGRSVAQVEQGTVLVEQAGKTMSDIVGSIQRVSDIVAEITSASVAQSTDVSQVGEAVRQMDQVTQQNAALVEESAAAAESLKGQAHQLVQAVSVFKLSSTAG